MEAVLHRLLDEAPLAFALVDARGRTVFVNRAFVELFGSAPPAEYSTLKDDLLAQAGLLERAHEVFTGKTVHLPVIWYDPRELSQVAVQSGRRRAVAATVLPLPPGAKTVEMAAVLIQDVTAEREAAERQESLRREAELIQRHLEAEMVDRTRTENLARVSEERLRLALRATGLGVWAWDDATRELVWDPRTREILGFGPDVPASQERFLQLVHRDDLPAMRRAFDALFDATQPGRYHLEVRIRRASDGAERCIEGWGESIRQGKRVTRAVGVTHDITERREILRKIQESEERLRLAVEATAMGTWTWDITKGVAAFDDRSGELLGVPPEASVDYEAFIALIHEDDRERTHVAIQRALDPAGAGRYIVEFRVKSPEGHRWVQGHGEVAFEDGRPVQVIGAALDVTPAKRAEEDLRRQVARANEAVRIRDEFLSIASHELKTPITPLQLHLDSITQLLDGPGASPAQLRVGLQAARRQTRRLTKLIDNLLDTSRITAGRLTLEREEVDLSEVAREVVTRFRTDTRGRTATIDLDAPTPAIGTLDRTRIEQVMENLLSNAVKFGNGEPIQVAVHGTDERVELQVRDRGIGIKVEDVPRIFDRFERAVSNRHFGGLGLGLYIARQIVEAHAGTISVSSAPGSGTTFTVTLPRGAGRPRAAAETEE